MLKDKITQAMQKKIVRQKSRNIINLSKLFVCLIVSGMLFISLLFTNEINYFFKFQYDFTDFILNSYEVHFVDVGQGDAVLIKFSNGETMLVDSGVRSAQNNLINYIDNIFFRSKKTKAFDHVVLTHGDSDHLGNMLYILENYPITNFYAPTHKASTKMYTTFLERLNEFSHSGKVNVKSNKAGLELVINTEKVTWLTPLNETYSDVNDYSPIMLFEFNDDTKLMLTGDATKRGELEAVNYFSHSVDIDILKLGHHGSSTSTSLVFLETFTPEIVVISYGKSNSYGHPSKSTLETLLEYDYLHDKNTSNYLGTALSGNIIFYVNNKKVSTTTFITNINDYVFTSWVYIALPAGGLLLILAFVPIKLSEKEWKKLQNQKLSKLLKRNKSQF